MRRFVLLTAITAFLAFAFSCASTGRNESTPGPVKIEVNNNLRTPIDVTVFIASAGTRQILGLVGPSATKTFVFTPRSYNETYRLVGEIPLSRPIRSQPFIVGSEMTGIITWTLVPNIVGFWEAEEDTTLVDTTTTSADSARQ
jgi:hypothetical protein